MPLLVGKQGCGVDTGIEVNQLGLEIAIGDGGQGAGCLVYGALGIGEASLHGEQLRQAETAAREQDRLAQRLPERARYFERCFGAGKIAAQQRKSRTRIGKPGADLGTFAGPPLHLRCKFDEALRSRRIAFRHCQRMAGQHDCAVRQQEAFLFEACQRIGNRQVGQLSGKLCGEFARHQAISSASISIAADSARVTTMR